jgi:hypothetical protein
MNGYVYNVYIFYVYYVLNCVYWYTPSHWELVLLDEHWPIFGIKWEILVYVYLFIYLIYLSCGGKSKKDIEKFNFICDIR